MQHNKHIKTILDMIIDERTSRKETLIECARQIMTAGRTAPKGKGIALIEIVTITDEKI